MSADREDADEYLEAGGERINWSKLGGELGRGSLYALILAVFGVFMDVYWWVWDALDTLASLPAKVLERARLGELTAQTFETALASVTGPGAFIISLVIVLTLLVAIDRATVLAGVR